MIFMYNSCLHFMTLTHRLHYLPVAMTNTIYACCLSTYLRISTAAALTISTPYLHSSAQPPVAAPEAGTATTPLCHAGTAQLTSFSV